VEQVFLVLASGALLERLVFALAVGLLVVEVDPARQLERLVLAAERQERLVLALAFEVDPNDTWSHLSLIREMSECGPRWS